MKDEVEIMEQQPGFAIMPRDGALTRVICAAERSRMEELGLGDSALARWVNFAYGLQSMAVDYEPSGKVHSIDIFHAVPLKQAAASREKWTIEHLSQWRIFSRTEPRFYAVGGAHYTMLGPEHVAEFAGKLKTVMKMGDVQAFRNPFRTLTAEKNLLTVLICFNMPHHHEYNPVEYGRSRFPHATTTSDFGVIMSP